MLEEFESVATKFKELIYQKYNMVYKKDYVCLQITTTNYRYNASFIVTNPNAPILSETTIGSHYIFNLHQYISFGIIVIRLYLLDDNTISDPFIAAIDNPSKKTIKKIKSNSYYKEKENEFLRLSQYLNGKILLIEETVCKYVFYKFKYEDKKLSLLIIELKKNIDFHNRLRLSTREYFIHNSYMLTYLRHYNFEHLITGKDILKNVLFKSGAISENDSISLNKILSF